MRWIIQKIKIVDEIPDVKTALPEIKISSDLGEFEGETEPAWEFPAWSYDTGKVTKRKVAVGNNTFYYEDVD